MRVLVLGGTRFFGKVLVRNLIEQGYEVTIGTRGNVKDDFGNKVNRIILDRTNKETMEEALKDKSYDVVYDNICFTSNEAKMLLDIIKDKTKKYIVTSTVAVYDFNKNIKEEEFDPYNYNIVYGDRTDFTYGEGKRQVEAIAFQKYHIPTIAVRFPVVLGKDDYTERLNSYVKNIMEGKAMNISNLEDEFSFITSEEAGNFLAYLCNCDFEGPINAASDGSIKISEVIEYITKATSKEAIIHNDGEQTPYNWIKDCSQDNYKARKLGFDFYNIRDYISKLIEHYIETNN